MFRKILVPIDGSEQSHRAMFFALDLAKRYTAEIILLSVAKQYFQEPLFPPLSTPSYDNSVEDVHEKILSQSLIEAKKIDSKIKISKNLISGRPADKIVEFAHENEIDLIVMGSRGLGGIKEYFLGSVSDRVADHAPCPVLIVK